MIHRATTTQIRRFFDDSADHSADDDLPQGRPDGRRSLQRRKERRAQSADQGVSEGARRQQDFVLLRPCLHFTSFQKPLSTPCVSSDTVIAPLSGNNLIEEKEPPLGGSSS